MKDPDSVKLSGEELEQVKKEISESNLSESTKTLLNGLIQFCLWLHIKLEKSRISILKLKKLFFIKSEKRGRKKNDSNSENEPTTTSDNDIEKANVPLTQKSDKNPIGNSLEPLPKKRIGHGRLSTDDYPNAQTITILHPDYKAGEPCPSEWYGSGELVCI